MCLLGNFIRSNRLLLLRYGHLWIAEVLKAKVFQKAYDRQAGCVTLVSFEILERQRVKV